MQAFLAGTDVQLEIPLQENDGNLLSVDSIEYRVIDQDSVEIVARGALSGFVAGDPAATIAVSALLNTLATGQAREMRSVELYCVIAGNTVVMGGAYVIELADPLQVGVSSFQTYVQAQFAALSIPNTPGWDGASEDQRIAALIDARSHIVQLNFSQL